MINVAINAASLGSDLVNFCLWIKELHKRFKIKKLTKHSPIFLCQFAGEELDLDCQAMFFGEF